MDFSYRTKVAVISNMRMYIRHVHPHVHCGDKSDEQFRFNKFSCSKLCCLFMMAVFIVIGVPVLLLRSACYVYKCVFYSISWFHCPKNNVSTTIEYLKMDDTFLECVHYILQLTTYM